MKLAKAQSSRLLFRLKSRNRASGQCVNAFIMTRRGFLRLTGGAVVGSLVGSALASPSPSAAARVQAIAFDAFAIFDPRPVFALAEELFAGKGTALSQAWRTRQFEYTWWRTTAKLALKLRPFQNLSRGRVELRVTAIPSAMSSHQPARGERPACRSCRYCGCCRPDR